MPVPEPGSHTGLPRPQTTPTGQPQTTAEYRPHHSTRTLIRSSRTLIKVLSLLIFAACAMAALLSIIPAAGHDQLWFLLMARRWLPGSTLYGPEIFDSNTPAIVWLSAIPVALAQHLHLPTIAVARLLVVLLEALVATLGLRLLRRLIPEITRPQTLWLAFSFILVFACLPARDFGQRDHLTALLCLPYVLATAADVITLPPTSRLRLFAGTLAAVGICLKPQQTLIPLTLELTLLLAGLRRPHQRTASLRRPEPWLLLAIGFAFVAAVHHLTPLFFTLTLPTLLSTYWAIGHLSSAQLLRQSPQLHLLALLTLTLFLLRKPDPTSSLRRPTALLLLAGLAATAAFYLQGTGWYYQQLPAISLFSCALALELLFLPRPRALPRWLPLATAGFVALALALTIHFGGLPLTHDAAYTTDTPDPAFFTGLAPGTPIAILTTSVEDSMMPVERFHLTWAQRTNNLWILPALLRQANPAALAPRHRLSPDRLAQLSAQEREWMRDDLLRWHPALLLVERCDDPAAPCQELEGLEASPTLHPDLLTFFLANPKSDPALQDLLTRHYRPTRTLGPYTAYTLSTPF